MIIIVASLTLRFYKKYGWTEEKIRKLLVNPKMKITLRKLACRYFPDYYAVYENSGFKIFKKSEINKHIIEDKQKFGGVDRYIDETK